MNTQNSELENLQVQVNVLKIRTFDAEDKVRELMQEQEKLQTIISNVISLLEIEQEGQVKIQDIYDAIEALKPQDCVEEVETDGIPRSDS
ncbi:hypothetical protein Pm5461_127 [Proteus phage vB_PmiM_Pm5461]|uniref:Chaperone for tail fiber formation n=1 Tax=Proteus phage vB_PmiM_Pm5461 TaxID=1636250 RepID=A0A0G2SS68_9CAUD|nr:tail fiber chaperone [Proteus phage vB_PmiM_Pm5461]AKA61993.1 hypothetical protein Pm5461_127 [Proteus phage vB_PmiM_Pm5461]